MTIPYLDCHYLLNLTHGMYADPDFDLEEHNRLFDKHYPPQTQEDHDILEATCMGKTVNKEKNDSPKDL